MNALGLNGRICYSGLPVFNQSYFAPSIQFQNTCLGDTTQFELGNTTTTAAVWNFGDGNTSTQQNPFHTYASSGLYSVTLEVTNTIGNDVLTFEQISTKYKENFDFYIGGVYYDSRNDDWKNNILTLIENIQ